MASAWKEVLDDLFEALPRSRPGQAFGTDDGRLSRHPGFGRRRRDPLLPVDRPYAASGAVFSRLAVEEQPHRRDLKIGPSSGAKGPARLGRTKRGLLRAKDR